MNSTPLCIHCRWHQPDPNYTQFPEIALKWGKCLHASNISMVTGTPDTYCFVHRAVETTNSCGAAARFFEPKDTAYEKRT